MDTNLKDAMNKAFKIRFNYGLSFERSKTGIEYPTKLDGEALGFTEERFVAGFKAGWYAAKESE